MPGPFIGASGIYSGSIIFGSPNGTPTATVRAKKAILGATTATTGTIMGWVRAGPNTGSVYPCFAQGYNGNTGFGLQLELFNSSGWKVRLRVLGNGNNLTVTSTSGTIVQGQWHFICAIQRNNGSGPALYIDGSPVTTSNVTAGTGTVNWWCANIAAQAGATPADANVRLGGEPLLTGTTEVAGVGPVAYWSNVALTNQNILDLWNVSTPYLYSQGATAARTSSHHDMVRKIVNPVLWLPMTVGDPANINTPSYVPNWGTHGISNSNSLYPPSGFVTADGNQAGPCLRAATIDLGDGSIHLGSNKTIAQSQTLASSTNTFTTGTINYWFNADTVTAVKQTIFGYGPTVVSTINLEVSANKKPTWRAQTASGANLYQVEANVTVEAGKWYMLTVTQSGSAIEIFVNGVKYTGGSRTVTTAGAGVDGTWWFNNITALGGSEFYRWGGAVGSATSDFFTGRVAHFWATSSVIADADILSIYNAAQAGAVFEPAITTAAPLHWWKQNDPGTYKDFGSSPLSDLTLVSTAPVLVNSSSSGLGTPDKQNALNWNNVTTNFATGTAGFGSSATGSVVVWSKNSGNGETFIAHSNTANEVNTLVFGVKANGVGTDNRMSACMSTTAFTSRRVWEGNTDLTSILSDGNWHMFVWTADGSATMKLYLDGAAQTVSEITAGTPPASTAWTSAVTDANSRTVIGNARFASGSSNTSGTMAHIQVYDRVLTPTEISAMYAVR
jgi:hypothetical protein